jgi:hypothetical protein
MIRCLSSEGQLGSDNAELSHETLRGSCHTGAAASCSPANTHMRLTSRSLWGPLRQ